MKFLLYTADKTEPAPLTPKGLEEMGKLIADGFRTGIVLQTGGFDTRSKRVVTRGGKTTVIDGPFTETKELTGGYALIQVRSEDEAVAWAKRFRDIVGDGESIVQRVYDPDEFQAGTATLSA